MVTLAEPKQSNPTEQPRDGFQPAAGPSKPEPGNQPAAPERVSAPIFSDRSKTKRARLSQVLSAILDWVAGPPTTHQQRLALKVAEFNDSRTARIMAFDF